MRYLVQDACFFQGCHTRQVLVLLPVCCGRSLHNHLEVVFEYIAPVPSIGTKGDFEFKVVVVHRGNVHDGGFRAYTPAGGDGVHLGQIDDESLKGRSGLSGNQNEALVGQIDEAPKVNGVIVCMGVNGEVDREVVEEEALRRVEWNWDLAQAVVGLSEEGAMAADNCPSGSCDDPEGSLVNKSHYLLSTRVQEDRKAIWNIYHHVCTRDHVIDLLLSL